MNRTLVLLLSAALLLTACAPPGEGTGRGTEPVEVVRETSTPPPTPTPIPTPTLHPAFVDLQSRLAELGLTLLPDGTIETTADGGRRTVPDLLVSPEGIISLTLKDGTVVTVTPEDMSVDEAGGLKIKGYEWDSEQGGWVAKATYTLEQLQAMSAQEKLAAAPERIEDLTKSNLSTVPGKDYLVLYRDENGVAQKVRNLLTGETLGLPEAGIIEFIMKDGQRLEMAWFETVQEAIDYLYLERGANSSTRERMQYIDAIKKSHSVYGVNGSNFPDELGREYISGYEVLYDKNDRSKIAFGTYVIRLANGTMIDGYTKDNVSEPVFINQDANEVANLLGMGLVTVSLPDGQ